MGKRNGKSGIKTKAMKHIIAQPVCWMVVLGVTITGLIACFLCYSSTKDCLSKSMSETSALAEKYVVNELDKVEGFLSVMTENEAVYSDKIPAAAKDAALTEK